MSLTDLQRFRLDAQGQPTDKAEDPHEWPAASFLAFDQSIADTGWAYGTYSDGTVKVIAGGNIRTDALAVGHEDTLRRAVVCHRMYRDLIATFTPEVVIHEMPPVASHMARPESSLVSAAMLRLACDGNACQVRMVAAQRAKKVATGNGNAKKGEVKQALLAKLDLTGLKPLNQAIIDAVALAYVVARGED